MSCHLPACVPEVLGRAAGKENWALNGEHPVVDETNGG